MGKKINDVEILKKSCDHDAEHGSLDIYIGKYLEFNDHRYLKNILDLYKELGLKSFFIDCNIEQAKQHFYVSGKLDEYLIKNHDTILLPHRMCNVLLSDSPELINTYAHIKNSTYDRSAQNDGVNFHAMQNIIKRDWDGLKQNLEVIDKLIRKIRNFWVKFYELCKQYYEGILAANKSQVEEAIAQLVEPKFQKKRVLSYTINLIDVFGASFAKLAWLNGIEVEVDSPLVPKELLPINPNKTYTLPYDFLK